MAASTDPPKSPTDPSSLTPEEKHHLITRNLQVK